MGMGKVLKNIFINSLISMIEILLFYELFGYPNSKENILWKYIFENFYNYFSLGNFSNANQFTHMIYQFIGAFFAFKISSLLFYLVHRLFHQVAFLKKFHLVHHEFQYPIGLAAMYSHWLEMVLVNTPTVILPAWLTFMNPTFYYIWIASSSIYTILAHDGHIFPYSDSTFHDRHHSHGTGNYGHTNFWDKLFNTEIKD
jgi:sterol desaturase/sphingolipid hydroxylase (fatty acid hydroxylase superfamily)